MYYVLPMFTHSLFYLFLVILWSTILKLYIYMESEVHWYLVAEFNISLQDGL